MKKIVICSVASLFALFFSVAQAIAGDFSPEQTKSIEKIVHNYLLTNPEVLMEASKSLQLKQVQSAIHRNAKKLFASSATPMAGNKRGSVNVVMFFDYQCPHCKRMVKSNENIMKQNPEVRFVFKELPIFGATSQFASSAALAAAKQGKYIQFHNKLMETKGRLSEDDVIKVAKAVGLNVDKMKKDMKSQTVLNELKQNYLLADSLSIQGTPAFIVGRYPSTGNNYNFIPGATTAQELQAAINQVKKGS